MKLLFLILPFLLVILLPVYGYTITISCPEGDNVKTYEASNGTYICTNGHDYTHGVIKQDVSVSTGGGGGSGGSPGDVIVGGGGAGGLISSNDGAYTYRISNAYYSNYSSIKVNDSYVGNSTNTYVGSVRGSWSVYNNSTVLNNTQDNTDGFKNEMTSLFEDPFTTMINSSWAYAYLIIPFLGIPAILIITKIIGIREIKKDESNKSSVIEKTKSLSNNDEQFKGD